MLTKDNNNSLFNICLMYTRIRRLDVDWLQTTDKNNSYDHYNIMIITK